ncbi:hypothetical protein [Cystobacter ferrugineus]|uniref:Uncharacterized protein n=1 Tax=Cystobacter ferrugineus TaxID=83449 RepID=A0A1L9AZY3_9BACT|nr:hypothetical protein [Cystobacter ferrugineus]OJH35569.1 hypothetical protein BON30_36445 [Cystobacter ferrugineus]
MPIDPGEVQQRDAAEANKRELRYRMGRVRGHLDATAAASKFFARVNHDTRIEHDEAEAELRMLEASGAVGFTDGRGEFSPVDNVAKGERQAGATDGYEWLVANPTGDAAGFTTEVAAGMLAHATARGRTQPLQRAVEVVPLWLTVALAANKIPAADWPSFRDLLLAAVDLATALESRG